MVDWHEDKDTEDGIAPLTDLVAVVAMDLVKNQHVERLHPKYWLGAARSLRYLADVLFELESPFAETFTLSSAPFIDVTPTEQKSGEVGKADRPVSLTSAACRT
jgi:hypothetical protein